MRRRRIAHGILPVRKWSNWNVFIFVEAGLPFPDSSDACALHAAIPRNGDGEGTGFGRINAMGIDFLTLRRCSASLLNAIADAPEGDRKQVRLNNVGRNHRTPRVLDRCVRISGYPGDIRQPAIRDLDHDRPTLLPTNQTVTSADQLAVRHAGGRVIKIAIADAIKLFHMDALSAAMPKELDLDIPLTLMASGLLRLLAVRIGIGKQAAKSCTLFRNFIKALADITIGNDSINVWTGRRANNLFLLHASCDETDIAVPWLKDRR